MGYGQTTASGIRGRLSIAADKGIPQLRPSSIVLPTCHSAEFYYLTAYPRRIDIQIDSCRQKTNRVEICVLGIEESPNPGKVELPRSSGYSDSSLNSDDTIVPASSNDLASQTRWPKDTTANSRIKGNSIRGVDIATEIGDFAIDNC